MVLLAFSLQDQVEKYGAYVGIAAFFGLAVLSLLYFAQAREVKRLREWAGRAPERAAELEQAVAEHAETVRRAQETVAAQPQPAAQPAVAAANGAVRLEPAEVAALAFARAAGVHEPHPPRPHPAPAAALAAPTDVATSDPTQPAPHHHAAVATGEPAAAQALAPATNGGGDRGAVPPPAPDVPPPAPAVPKPATPAARRAEPVPPRRTVAPKRRAPAPPPRRESSTRTIVATLAIGVIVLAAAAFAATRLLGGDEEPTQPNIVPTPTQAADSTPSAPPAKDTVTIKVLNGTGIPQLAARYQDELVQEGYAQANVTTGNAPEAQQRGTSIVMYGRGEKAAAQEVATAIGIEELAQLDAPTQALLANESKQPSVVVIVGTDKS